MHPPQVCYNLSINQKKKYHPIKQNVQRSYSNAKSTVQKHCMQIGLDSEEPRVPVEALQSSRILIEATDG